MAGDELWDVTDVTGAAIGRLHRRADPVPVGLFHIVASVCLVRGDGLVLMSCRSANKDWPLCWELPAGSILAGESSAEGASRELAEEVGVCVTRPGGGARERVGVARRGLPPRRAW